MSNLVKTRNESLIHPSVDFLKAYATEGLPSNYSLDWSTDHIEASLCCGPHPSENPPAAMKALHVKTSEKIKNIYAKVLRYGNIKGNTPEKLKISPITMIPHK